MGEVNAPFVGWQVRTFRFRAQVAQEALFHHLAVVGAVDAVHFHGVRFVHQIEQRRERVTEVHATAAAVANVKDALELRIERVSVPVFGAAPVDGLAARRFEIAFLHPLELTNGGAGAP